MATLYIGKDTHIDYSLMDGSIREFVLRGQELFNEATRVETPGWRDALIWMVKAHRLDTDIDGRGLHAFVTRLINDGVLRPEHPVGLTLRDQFAMAAMGLISEQAWRDQMASTSRLTYRIADAMLEARAK